MSNYSNTYNNIHAHILDQSSADFDKYRCDFLIKIIIIGDAGVGKSSILKQFASNDFDTNTVSTVGIDFEIAYIKIKDDDSSRCMLLFDEQSKLHKPIKEPIIKFQIWDCAGQERFYSIVKSYIRGAHVVVYAFDITDKKSFTSLQRWVCDVEKEIGTPRDGKYMCVVVGNKSDQSDQREVLHSDAVNFAEQLNTTYFEVSAKENIHIDTLFLNISTTIYRKLLNKQLNIDYNSIIPVTKRTNAHSNILKNSFDIQLQSESDESESDDVIFKKCPDCILL